MEVVQHDRLRLLQLFVLDKLDLHIIRAQHERDGDIRGDRRDIVLQRRRWVLDDGHGKAIFLEMVVDSFPA